MAERFDPTVFYDCLDMDMATAYIQHAGASEAATNVVSDLVNSGAYHMPADIPEGGYAILRISPIIVGDSDLQHEPLEFGANIITPDMTDWSRRATDRMRTLEGSSSSIRSQAAVKILQSRLADVAFDGMSVASGGVEMSGVEEIVRETPSRMLGGVITGLLFYPEPDEGVRAYVLPYWHRALEGLLNVDALLSQAPRVLRKKLGESLQDEQTLMSITLVRLFQRTVDLETVSINDNVNLKLPPKRFIR